LIKGELFKRKSSTIYNPIHGKKIVVFESSGPAKHKTHSNTHSNKKVSTLKLLEIFYISRLQKHTLAVYNIGPTKHKTNSKAQIIK